MYTEKQAQESMWWYKVSKVEKKQGTLTRQ